MFWFRVGRSCSALFCLKTLFCLNLFRTFLNKGWGIDLCCIVLYLAVKLSGCEAVSIKSGGVNVALISSTPGPF